MSSSMTVSHLELRAHLLKGTPFLDVRAPIEFIEGHIPDAHNGPILDDNQRAEVGTIYKKRGQVAAIERGHLLVGGDLRESRIQAWSQLIQENPSMIVYCFRGGLRSQTAQSWLKAAGHDVLRLNGGYKAARQIFLETIQEATEKLQPLIVSGPTGSGKTHLLNAAKVFFPAVDLEGLACHKGSAFGAEPRPQPRQAQFENLLSVQLLELLSRSETKVLLEDESRLIGQNVIPEGLFNKMRGSPVVWVDEPLTSRVENIFHDYILTTAIAHGAEMEALTLYQKYEKSLTSIQRRLGGARTQEIMADLKNAQTCYLSQRDLAPNRVWIEKLLIYYYDPLYLSSLDKRQPKVLFRGLSAEVLGYLREFGFKEADISHG
jgi:tRNA 2-selenouridine synthase